MSTGLLRSMKAKLGGGQSKPKPGSAANDKQTSPAPAQHASKIVQQSGISTNLGLNSNASSIGNPADHRHPAARSREAMLLAYRDPLPSFRDAPQADRQELFAKKLQLCTYTFDFTDPTSDLREKEIKRLTLQELVDYINSGSGKFTEALAPFIVAMLSANLFRALPPSRHGASQESYDLDEEEPALEPAWPHLATVYEFLLRYVVSSDTDAKVAKRYIDQEFVVKLLDLFDSEDPRERDYLKTILHRIYERHNGIAELLEILGSIINGFALPLKEEHKQFLARALLPLHKPKCLPLYQQQLSYCVTQFVEKDPRLAEPVILGLLRFWPATNSHKEVLFLGEIEEVLELTQSEEFGHVAVPLFRRIGRCLTSSHFQVGERSLFLWNNEYIVQLVSQHRQSILPIVVGALERNAKHHWNPAVHNLSLNVRKMFQEMDAGLYEECRRKFEESEARHPEREAARQRQWEAIERDARR